MSVSRPTTVELSARQRALLRRVIKRQAASVRLARRVNILLALADDPCLESVSGRLGLTRAPVRLWRDRWLGAADRLRRAEADDAHDGQLLELIEQILGDAPRSGKPATFSPEQIVGMVAVACGPPEKSGRPVSHWASAGLAGEVKKRQIVKDMSPRGVGRFLKRGRPPASQEPLLAQRRPT